jgi:hypothetical protein
MCAHRLGAAYAYRTHHSRAPRHPHGSGDASAPDPRGELEPSNRPRCGIISDKPSSRSLHAPLQSGLASRAPRLQALCPQTPLVCVKANPMQLCTGVGQVATAQWPFNIAVTARPPDVLSASTLADAMSDLARLHPATPQADVCRSCVIHLVHIRLSPP